MRRTRHPAKKPATLSSLVHRRLELYALAASATGIAVGSQPAEAKIVYTPANVPIVGTVNLDLNHDGLVDFKIRLFPYGAEAFVDATSLGQNRVWGSGFLASHLLAGVRIGPNQKKFAQGDVHCGTSSTIRTCKAINSFFDFSGYFSSKGPWAKTKSGYLGLKFYIQGKVHFGWARLQRAKLGEDWVLTGYAYETVAGKPIVTGKKKGSDEIGSVGEANPASISASASQPATLGMLALGAPALALYQYRPARATQYSQTEAGITLR